MANFKTMSYQKLAHRYGNGFVGKSKTKLIEELEARVAAQKVLSSNASGKTEPAVEEQPVQESKPKKARNKKVAKAETAEVAQA